MPEEQEALIYSIRFGEYPSHQPGYAVADLPRRTDDSGFIGDRDRRGNSDIISTTDLERLGKKTVLSPKDQAKLIKTVNAYMIGLADRTGGRNFEVEQIADLESAFRGRRWRIGRTVYYRDIHPTVDGKDGERRRITVKVNVPNVAVRSRNEVIYKKPKK